MNDLFLALMLISILGLIVGIINPKLAVFWSKNKTRKQAALGYLLSIAFFLVSFGVTVPQDNTISSDNTPPPAVSTNTEAVTPKAQSSSNPKAATTTAPASKPKRIGDLMNDLFKD